MKIDIITLFPEMLEGFFNNSIIKRAIDSNKLEINYINFRDFTYDNQHQVDDTPYGGGAGMVLKIEPLVEAIESVKTNDSLVILTSPKGKTYNEEMALSLSKYKHLIIVCGHYEGVDERINSFVDTTISIGDYILTGGEIASAAIVDSVARLIPGVIEEESKINESFNNNLLDYPTYTRPYDFRGLKVPDVLLSGDHKKIEEWRKKQQMEDTKRLRPDLMEKDNV